MQFSISKENISRLLYLANTIVEKRNTMPILANVKLTAEEDSVSIAATDLEVSLSGNVEAEVQEPGSITVDARVFYDIVRELPEGELSFKLGEGQRLELKNDNSSFKIVGTSSEEFPALVGTTLANPLSVDASVFYEILDKTAFAVSTDETRYNINGVYIESLAGESAEKVIRLVATDGHRLAIVDRPVEGLFFDKPVIIPRKGIQEIKKVLENNDGAAKVSVSEGFFTVQSGNVTLGIRLVDGQFPDYKQVIPDDSTTEVIASRSELLSAVKRVSLVTTDKSKAVKFKLDSGNLIISSSSPEYGEAIESISVEQDGDDLSIGFSARYLIDLLGANQQSESIKIKLKGDLGPGVFVGDADESYRCIVMPMRFE